MTKKKVRIPRWTTRKILYQKEFRYVDLKRHYDSDMKEYSIRIDQEVVGCIVQTEDFWFTPYFEKYDTSGRITDSSELFDSKSLITAISRIIKEYDYLKDRSNSYDNYQ